MTLTETPSTTEAIKRDLDVFIRPKAVAVIGATEKTGAVGRTILWNLISSPFGGTVYPVNPKRSSVLGVKAYASVSVLPEAPELAVIATPAHTVPELVGQCAAAGVSGCIIISAGFRESGAEGAALEQQALEQARSGGVRI